MKRGFRVSILWKLLAAYLLPTAAMFTGFGLYALYSSARALDDELGRRLSAIASTAATQIAGEGLGLLQPGDEETRTYRNLRRRLEQIKRSTGMRRVYVFYRDRSARCDTEETAIGARFYTLDAHAAEIQAASAGTPSASFLFRGPDDLLYKSGFAAVPADAPEDEGFVVAVDAPASFQGQLARLRRELIAAGLVGALIVALLTLLVSRFLIRPIWSLESAAQRIGAGDLDAAIVATSRDEIGHLAGTLETMRLQLRARDERLQMMLAGIAHEVRNPLGGMELYAGLLREELAGDTERLSLLERVERELKHLSGIVNDFLSYARRVHPPLVPIDVRKIMEDVLQSLRPLAADYRTTVESDLSTAMALGDEAQLKRALLNLVTNAIEATLSEGRVKVSVATEADRVVIRITDNGMGMDEETRAKIFTAFYTTKQKGTGLGLAFVRDIADDHGARLDVQSELNRGTTFTLSLGAA